jgi:uncharacterized protein (TIGR02145 family)
MRFYLIFLFLLAFRLVYSQEVEHFVDVQDIQKYNEVIIAEQTWMAQNLDVITFRNGDTIPQARTDEEWKVAGENKQPAWCYYNNEKGENYGKLYNCFAINDPRGLAPEGWSIPNREDWISFCNETKTFKTKKSLSISVKYKSLSGDTNHKKNRILGLKRDKDGSFSGMHTNSWWCMTDDGALTLFSIAHKMTFFGNYFGIDEGMGCSVRCIRAD